MVSPVNLIVTILAIYRISAIISRERGPFDFAYRLRKAFGVKHENYFPMPQQTGVLATAISCMYCLPIYLGFIAAGLWLLSPGVALLLSFPFAVSEAVLLIMLITEKISRGWG